MQGNGYAPGVLCNITAALHDALPHYFWVGFYVVRDGELHLGPFQGPVACYRIKKGRGVCGTAWAKAATVVVPDVDQFPGHIACSSLSRSEIVVPIISDGEVVAIIDVDSRDLNAFDATDQHYLEQLACLLASTTLFAT
ncbi:MAG: GAF domain-containing protein [Bacteroidales bacterium]|nr:GAF domain-containing protein [Bacteroidales bacterium]